MVRPSAEKENRTRGRHMLPCLAEVLPRVKSIAQVESSLAPRPNVFGIQRSRGPKTKGHVEVSLDVQRNFAIARYSKET